MAHRNQEAFVKRIRQALGRGEDAKPQEGTKSDHPAPGLSPVQRSQEQQLALVDRFQAVARDLLMDVRTCSSREEVLRAIGSIVEETVPADEADSVVAAWKHPLIDALDLQPLLSDRGWGFFQPDLSPEGGVREMNAQRAGFRNKVIASAIGITSADFCLADTATLVMLDRPGQARSVSLVPATHIAVVPINRLLFDLQELFALLRPDHAEADRQDHMGAYLNLISGPSKTADIEMAMVHGVHGPRCVHILILTDWDA